MPEGTEELAVTLLAGERWWGGAVADGQYMPFGDRPHHRDLAANAGFVDDATGGANQSAPLLLSTRGRYVWSDDPFEFTFAPGRLVVRGQGLRMVTGTGERATLAGAFQAASATHFPPSGQAPGRAMFTGPQYNTWIEMPYAPTQDKVLAYVRGVLDAGFPPGLVMIDDRWSQDYGTWRFDPATFPDPAAMVAQLHAWGCPVMLWLVPFVSPDSAVFRDLQARDLLVKQGDGQPAIRAWWNGYSAVLDVTNPAAVDWLCRELGTLRSDHGIDGFKFDAGDLRDYRDDDVVYGDPRPVAQCQAWARVGARYEFNEFRACWKHGGAPLAQRLHDKPATWDGHGLASLIPESIVQGLIGHPYTCPDMVGGGDLGQIDAENSDQELFVRYAQLAALNPMMQFSLAPQRWLDEDHLAAVRAAVTLRQDLMPELLELVDHAAAAGEPILRPLAYHDPADPGTTDEFTLGPDILVAPVLERGARRRRVVFPAGTWTGTDGTDYTGPVIAELTVDLYTIPWFRRRR